MVEEPMDELNAERIAERIREHGVTWVTAERAIDLESCVDGRDERPVLGLPGGTLGEVIVTAVAMEEVLDRDLTDEQLHRLVTTWVNYFGPIYLHTDLHGLRHLHEAMGGRKAFNALAIEAEILEPKGDRAQLLTLLLDPKTMGCGHIRNMVTYAAEYGARRLELVPSLLGSVYRMLWDPAYHDQVNYVVLRGDHQEQAVLSVNAKGFDEGNPQSQLPMVTPNVNDQQCFVYHPQLAQLQRKRSAERAYGLTGISELATREGELVRAMDTIGHRQLVATLSRLAKGKPNYQAAIGQRGAELDVFVREL